MATDNPQNSTSAKKPRSQAIVGWLGNGIAPPVLIESPETVSAGLNTCVDVHFAAGDGHGCASTSVPLTDTDSDIVGIIIGSPQWTEVALRTTAERQGDAAALVAAYNAYGEGLTDHLRGPFAFALLDPMSNTAMLGIDRMGRYPMYYCSTQHGLLFGSSAASILAMRPKVSPMRPQGLYDYVYFHMVPGPVPVFDGLAKLQAGCMVRYGGGRLRSRRYWLPKFRESTTKTRPEMSDLLKDRGRQAVSTSLPFGVWMREHRPLQDIAYDNILKLKPRGIFNPTFLDNAIELHRSGHAAYFGELVWILTILELWLEAHR
jgi:hypothetical protein